MIAVQRDAGLWPRKTVAGTVVHVELTDEGDWVCSFADGDRKVRLATSRKRAMCERVAEAHAICHGGWAE